MECSELALSGLLLGQRVSNSLCWDQSASTQAAQREEEKRDTHSAGLQPGWDQMQLRMSSVCHFEVTQRGIRWLLLNAWTLNGQAQSVGPTTMYIAVWMLDVTLIYRLLLHLHCQSYWYLTVILCQRLSWSNCSFLYIYFHMHIAKLNFTFFLSKNPHEKD